MIREKLNLLGSKLKKAKPESELYTEPLANEAINFISLPADSDEVIEPQGIEDMTQKSFLDNIPNDDIFKKYKI